MNLPKIRSRCKKCGGNGVLYIDTVPYSKSCPYDDGLFSVVCEDCGEETIRFSRPNHAIRCWNAVNGMENNGKT